MIPVLILTLLSLRVNDTFLEEQFYKDQLVEADIYNFFYTDVLTVAIDEQIDEAGGMPLNIDLTTEEIVAAIQATLPPDWIQRKVELAIDDAVPYLTGETDSLSLTVELSERADVALIVIQQLLNSMNLHATLFDEAIPDGIANSYGSEIDIALGITLTAEEVASAIKVVITPEFLEDLQTQAAEDIGSYLTGKSETFTFNIPLAEQIDVVRREFSRILQGGDLQPFILDEVLDPALDEFLNEGVELPLGVVITRAEIRQATEAALTPEWADAQADTLVNGVLSYLTGESDRFTVSVPIRDRIDVDMVILTTIVDQKYTALLNSLPACTTSQILAIALGNADPTSLLCTIPGLTVEALKSGLGIDPLDFLTQSITNQLPATITFTEQDFLASIGNGKGSDTLDDVRTAIRDGWTLDETDLRKLLTALDPASLDNLDYVRETIRDGWDWTEGDLLELIYDVDDLSYRQDIEDFDDVRSNIDRARSWNLGLPLLSLVVLGMTGIIGGRKWMTKLGWAAGALFISAMVVFVASGPLYDSLAKDELEKERTSRIETAEGRLESLVVAKSFDTVIHIGDAFFDGVESRALTLLLIGGVVMGGSVVFSIVGGGGSLARKPGKESILPPEPAAVAEIIREAEENLGEEKDSAFPTQPSDPVDTGESSENKDEEKN